MKRSRLTLALVLLLGGANAYAISYVVEYGTTAVNYPYSTQAQPAKNASYTDATFHTTITRVSDKAIDGYSGARLITGYSTFSGVSSDGRYIVLMMCDASAKYALYNASTNAYVKDLGLQSWNGDPEPRWDRSGSHPSWLYYVRGAKLMRMDVDNADPLGTAVTVHDFAPDYPACTYIKTDEEGDASADSRYWIFELRNSAWTIIRIVTYDKLTDTIMGNIGTFPYDINCVSVSPNGLYYLIDWQFTTHGTNSGPKVYNADLTLALPNEVKNDSTHWCWATMPDGHTGVVSQNNGTNYGGTQREADCMQAYDLVCATRAYVMYMSDMGWNGGYHFFNTGKRGWAGMYCYTADFAHDKWSYDQIYLMELKNNGRIFRVTFSQHNKSGGDYFDEGHAQMDSYITGAKLWFNANWRGTDNAEVYRVDLPTTWYEDLMGIAVTDTSEPYATNFAPAKNAVGVSSTTSISLGLFDDGDGVNISSVIFQVNGFIVYHGSSPASYPLTTVTGTKAHYVLSYNPPVDFSAGQVVTVSVDGQDLAVPPNIMTQDAYSFTIATITVVNAPSALIATVISSTTINLDWTDNSSNETGFKLERKTGVGGVYAQIATPTANAISYSNAGLTAGTTYFYRIKAYAGVTDSPYSNEVSTCTARPIVVTAPSGLNATAISSTTVNLGWTDNSSNETGFKLERKTGAGGVFAQIATPAANAVIYSDTGLTSGTTYFYRIRANAGTTDSAYSATTSAYVPIVVTIIAPAGLDATAISSTTIALSWTDSSSNETGFKLERKTGAGGTYTQIATPAQNVVIYSDTGLLPGTTYYYRIRAAAGAVDSAYSNEANDVTLQPLVLNSPANLTATLLSTTDVELHWTDTNGGNSAYMIERSQELISGFKALCSVDTGLTSYTDKGLSLGSTYYYRIQAYSGAYYSPYSATISVVPIKLTSFQTIDVVEEGGMRVIGVAARRGVINPRLGDTAKIYFKGNQVGMYECRIFDLNGQLVWQDAKLDLKMGMFEWFPRDMPSGGYVVNIKGPGFRQTKKIAIIK